VEGGGMEEEAGQGERERERERAGRGRRVVVKPGIHYDFQSRA